MSDRTRTGLATVLFSCVTCAASMAFAPGVASAQVIAPAPAPYPPGPAPAPYPPGPGPAPAPYPPSPSPYPPGPAPAPYPPQPGPAPYYGPQPYGQPQAGWAPAQPPGFHEHDGFYLRLFGGVGFSSIKNEDQDLEISGTAGAVAIAVGTTVAPNLVVYGEIFADVAQDPTIKVGGSEMQTVDLSVGNYGFGVGVAYYVQPMNLYVSGTLAASQISVHERGEDVFETEFGPSISLMVGKEWWISNDWGLGVAGQLFAGSMKDKNNEDSEWGATAIALGLTATYN